MLFPIYIPMLPSRAEPQYRVSVGGPVSIIPTNTGYVPKKWLTLEEEKESAKLNVMKQGE
jgi:hypothetical protein